MSRSTVESDLAPHIQPLRAHPTRVEVGQMAWGGVSIPAPHPAPPPPPTSPLSPLPTATPLTCRADPRVSEFPVAPCSPPPRRPRLLAQSPGCAMVAGAGGRGQQGDPPTSPPAPHGLAGTAAPRQPPMGGGMRRAGGGNGRGAGRL